MRNGLEPELVEAMAIEESHLNHNQISSAGAVGLMQVLPSTGRQVGIDDVYSLEGNIEAGARYMRQLMDKFNDKSLVIAAYNAGDGAVEKFGNQVPPYAETVGHVSKVTNTYEALIAERPPASEPAPATEATVAHGGVSSFGPPKGPTALLDGAVNGDAAAILAASAQRVERRFVTFGVLLLAVQDALSDELKPEQQQKLVHQVLDGDFSGLTTDQREAVLDQLDDYSLPELTERFEPRLRSKVGLALQSLRVGVASQESPYDVANALSHGAVKLTIP